MVLGLDTTLKKGIFGVYVVLWVSSHVLVYASKLAGAPEYNATSVVLLTELIKLAMATTSYTCYDGTAAQMWEATSTNIPLFCKYTVPAMLYCVYNNLVYTNLSVFDPGTYNVLAQSRLILTGLLWQWLFSKRLNQNQWLAMVLITLGCMVKEASKLSSTLTLVASLHAWMLLLAQLSASVFAGVYTELLLKGVAGIVPVGSSKTGGVTTNLQNAFLYTHSIGWNALFLVAQGRLGEALSLRNLSVVSSPTVLAIMAIMSSVGIVTGFFLKHLDSVLKAIASATEIVFTMLASSLLFATPLDARSIASAFLVGAGVALYARPVARSAATPDRTTEMETRTLLTDDELEKGKDDTD
jgi:UDP-sugar transporter A1/2/3